MTNKYDTRDLMKYAEDIAMNLGDRIDYESGPDEDDEPDAYAKWEDDETSEVMIAFLSNLFGIELDHASKVLDFALKR